MGKRIILLSDGTGNAASAIWRTNVWRLFEALDLSGNDQVAIYDDGVGSSSFRPMALVTGAVGFGLRRNVLDLYRFVCRNYKQGDEIFGFGFSRGAFTIRVAAGLIVSQGLVTAGSESELARLAKAAYRNYRRERYWRQHWLCRRVMGGAKGPAIAPTPALAPPIRFLGLWDTVAAYGLPIDEMARGFSRFIWPLELPDRELNAKVQRACHALSLDDERQTFHPVLWTEPYPTTAAQFTDDERISQVWFPGVHANVGGGYPDDSLAHISLLWIAQEATRCGLKLKPGALDRFARAADKDGRLYDSRRGLAGYYRYSPRRLEELCNVTSVDRRDAVHTNRPKIHDSALWRMQVGAQRYAPIGLPDDYDLVRFDHARQRHAVVPLADNPFEDTAEAQARAKAQETVWDVIWLRRVVHLLTVFVSLALAIYPIVTSPYRADEYETMLRPLSDLIRLVGEALPGMFDWWVDAYARSPGVFLVLVAAVMGLIATNNRLGAWAADRMGAIWKPGKGTHAGPAPSGIAAASLHAVRAVRTSGPLSAITAAIKRTFTPCAWAVVIFWVGLTVPAHLASFLGESVGGTCTPSEPSGLAVGESRRFEFKSSDPCLATGIQLEEGSRYRIEIKVDAAWADTLFGHGAIASPAAGFLFLEAGWYAPLWLAGEPLKRVWQRPWFRIIARIGATGDDTYFLDPDPKKPTDRDSGAVVHRPDPTRLDEVIRARRHGELFFYVNDAVLPVPWIWDLFYGGNTGVAEVTVTRR